MQLRSLVTLFALLAPAVAAGCSDDNESRAVMIRPLQSTPLPAALVEQMISEADLTLGEEVFSQNCTACHGEMGRGDGASVRSGAVSGVPDFTNPSTLTTSDVSSLYQVITDGRLEKFMPPWGRILSEKERWSAAMYVFSLR